MTRKFLSRMLKDVRGSTLVWFAVALPMLLAVVALAVDMSYMYFVRGKEQITASSAALAGAALLEKVPDDASVMIDAVKAEAELYADTKNLGLGLHGDDLQPEDILIGNFLENRTPEFLEGVDPEPDLTINVGYNAVRVTTRRSNAMNDGNSLDLLMATVIGETEIHTSATAIFRPGRGSQQACLVALHPTEKWSLRVSGTSGSIESPTCSICVNSNDPEAMRVDGQPTIDVDLNPGDDAAGSILVGGGLKGSPDNLNPPPLLNEDPAGPDVLCPDPYLNLDSPPVPQPIIDALNEPPCNNPGTVTFANGVHTVSAGDYCIDGQLDFAGSDNIVFEAGFHHLQGVELSINGGAKTGGSSGTGVTFLLTDATISTEGTKDFVVSAFGGPGEPFLVFQDPADNSGLKEHNIGGDVNADMQGIQYYGFHDVKLHGNGDHNANVAGCTAIIGRTIEIDGNVDMSLDSTNCGAGALPGSAAVPGVYSLVD